MSGESKPVAANLAQFDIDAFKRLSSLNARDLMDLVGYLSSARAVDAGMASGLEQPRAFVVDGFDVLAQGAPNMSVQVMMGLGGSPAPGSSGVVGVPQKTEDSNLVFLNKRVATAAQAITASDPALWRWDLIEVGPTASPATVGVDEQKITMNWSDAANDFVPSGGAVTVMQHGEPDIFYTAGTTGMNGVPTPTAGRIPIAVVRVPAAATTITQADIFDVRHFLPELARATSQAPSSIDIAHISVSNETDNPFVIHGEATAKGIPCAFRTDAVLNGSISYSHFFDQSTTWNTYTGFIYGYVVAADNKGYRYSRAHLTHATAPNDLAVGDYSHCGVFMWSTIPPSLVNGSLAPSATLTMPFVYGGTLVSVAGGGKAVCVATAYMTNGAWSSTLHYERGKARISKGSGTLPTLPLASGANPTWTTEAAGYSSLYSDWGATAPKGPLSYDMLTTFSADDTADAGRYRQFAVWAKEAASATNGYQLKVFPSVVSAGGAATLVTLHLKEIPVARNPNVRGATPDGFLLACNVVGASATGHGLTDPATTPPTHQIVGYRWPQGAIVV